MIFRDLSSCQTLTRFANAASVVEPKIKLFFWNNIEANRDSVVKVAVMTHSSVSPNNLHLYASNSSAPDVFSPLHLIAQPLNHEHVHSYMNWTNLNSLNWRLA